MGSGVDRDELDYLTGFGAHFESEAVPGALPKGRNSPQQPAFGLYTEQLSGSGNRHILLPQVHTISIYC